MSLLLKHDWSDTSVKWHETNHIQVAICNRLRAHKEHKKKFLFAARFNEGKRSAAMNNMMKLAGLTSGEPDIDIWLPDRRCLHIELKGPKTAISKDQIERHEELRSLGQEVYLVRASCPQDGINQVIEILEATL